MADAIASGGLRRCPRRRRRVDLKLASGVAPVPDMLRAGVRVGLGTDGAASNNELDLLAEIQLAALLHKGVRLDPLAVPAAAALEMATIGGARAPSLPRGPDPKREAALRAQQEAALALRGLTSVVAETREAPATWSREVEPLLKNYDGQLVAANQDLVPRFRVLYRSAPPSGAITSLEGRLASYSSASDLLPYRLELVRLRARRAAVELDDRCAGETRLGSAVDRHDAGHRRKSGRRLDEERWTSRDREPDVVRACHRVCLLDGGAQGAHATRGAAAPVTRDGVALIERTVDREGGRRAGACQGHY
jgi:amidohydrolase family protein